MFASLSSVHFFVINPRIGGRLYYTNYHNLVNTALSSSSTLLVLYAYETTHDMSRNCFTKLQFFLLLTFRSIGEDYSVHNLVTSC